MPDEMRYRVVAWPEGGTDPLKEWTETGKVDPSRPGDGRSPEWSRLCEGIVRWARSGKAGTTELFLCLLGEELRIRRDISYLLKLLKWAREHAWGAKLFLVASDDIHLNDLYEGREALEQWMKAAIRGKALDLLQVDYDLTGGQSIGVRHRLRDAASRALDRQHLLAARHLVGSSWRCVLPADRFELAHFLYPMVQIYGARDEGANLLVVVDRLEPEIQVKLVRKARRRYRDRRCVIATLETHPSLSLQRYCEENALTRPLYLRGDLELWYFLLRLNESPLSPELQPGAHLADPPIADHGEVGSAIHPVPIEDEPSFLSTESGKSPTILVTSSFNPDELGQCLEAARDVGWLVKRAPMELRLLVDPATNRETLLKRIEGEILDPVVWIHLGHGDGSQGLWELGSQAPVPPEKWLQCFRGRHFALALVLFLTCNSATIAEAFARAGAGVAIGFTNEVESHRCRILADQVLKSVLAKGLGRGPILEGFSQGRSDLMALEDHTKSDPVAFYPA